MPTLEQRTGVIGHRYAIERTLEQGGMSIVYEARDLRMGGAVAVKQLVPELAGILGTERFHREVKIAAALHHPNLLPILDSGDESGSFYCVSPYIEGGTLRDLLSRERQLPIARVVAIVRDVAAGVAFAHAHGVLHRDLKPENILLAGDRAVVADFGIARALSELDGEKITSTGIAVGTPAYMSPEQAGGEKALDARTDVYSLGCVLYEMIAGVPPFTGPTVQAVISQRFSHPPPEMARYRRGVPPALERVVIRALALAPADRFASVEELAAAVVAACDSPSSSHRTPRRTMLLVAGTAAVAAIATLAVPGVRGAISFGAASDSTRLAVLPLAVRGSGGGAIGQRLTRELDGELRRWRDLTVAPALDVEGALGGSAAPATADAAMRAAAAVGAGRAVWGTVAVDGDTARVRAAIYDVAHRRVIREGSASLATADAAPPIAALIATLLWDTRAGDPPDGAPAPTRSLTAWRAFGRGTVALRRWDLDAADRELATAASDPAFALAQLRLAELRSWRSPDDTTAWIGPARRAASRATQLTSADSIRAAALVALGERRFDDACLDYTALRTRDPLDARAWYGLGECLGRDDAVRADRRSRTGWAFRSGWESAARAWLRATQLEPHFAGVIGLARMSSIVATSAGRMRMGMLAQTDDLFFAYPELDHDTVAYIPSPARAFTSGATPLPPSRADALDHGRELVLRFADLWVAHAAGDPDALEAMGTAREMLGDLGDLGDARLTSGSHPQRSAMAAVAAARALARDSAQRLRLAVTATRLRVKLGDFAGARALADSVLGGRPSADSNSARPLQGLAALTGHVDRLARLFAADSTRSFATDRDLPESLRRAAGAFFARAIVGACDDELRSDERTLERLVTSYVDATRRDAVRAAVLDQGLAHAAPCLGGAAARAIGNARPPLVRMERALADGHPDAVRAILDTLAVRRRGTGASDLALDHVQLEAWLRTAIDDSAGAARQLDLALEALPVGSTALLTPMSAAGLVRAMALRAELAAARGDRTAARRWASAVITLWSDADPPLQPIVARMRALQSR